MRSVSFVVIGEPATKGRPRVTTRNGRVRTYTPDATKKAEASMAAAFIATVGSIPRDERCMFSVKADFYCGTGMRRDVDNMLKLVLDGLNKIAWDDDHQVMSVIGEKHFVDEGARTEVTIETVGIMPNRKADCLHCGVEFPRPKSHAAKKYCSMECRRAGLAANRTRKCAHCGNQFVRHGDVSEQRFCSQECRVESTHVAAVCASCGTSFRRARSLNRSGNAYCSAQCKATYWSERRTSAAKGTCDDCGGPTTKKAYKRCRDCAFKAGGRWADRDAESVKCSSCGAFISEAGCVRCA